MLKVDLSKKYTAHGKTFNAVEFRKPKLSEFLRIGDVQEWQPNGQNGSMLVEYGAAIGEYVTLLCTEPGAECLEDIDLCDQVKIKDAIKGFFTEARLLSSTPTD